MASEVFLKDASVPLIRDARLRRSSRCDAVLQMKLFDRSIFKWGGGGGCLCVPHGEPGLCCVRPDGLYAASFTDLIAVLIWEGLGESPTICSCRITQRLSVTYNGGGSHFQTHF